jgi:hypothetical protein
MSYQSTARSAYLRASVQVDAIFSGTVPACIMDHIGSVNLVGQMPKPTTAGDRRSIREAYRTCFTWLTRPRDSQELLELSQGQCSCGSGVSTVPSHRTGLEVMEQSGPSFGQPFFVLAGQILRLFCTNLDAKQITGVQETRQRVHRLHQSQNWPGTWQEMLPHGPKGTMFALFSLLDANPTTRLRYSAMSVIGRIVRYCHPLVAPILICSHRMVIATITASVRECQQIFTRQTTSDIPDLQALVMMKDCLTSIAVLLLGLFQFSHETQRTMFHVEGGIYLFKSYSAAALLCRTLAEKNRFLLRESVRAQSSAILEKLALLGGWMYDDYPDSRKQKIDASLVDLFDQQSSRQIYPQDHTWALLLGLLHYLEVWQQCAAPGCSYTLVDGPLRRCAGCVRVAYCSRACQKRAWKHAIPHRNVCSVLAQLQKKFRPPYHNVYFWDVPEELVNSSAELALADSALDHFARLVKYNMEILSELAVTRRHPDTNIPQEVNSNKKNPQTTADGRLEGCDASLE